MNAGFDAVVGSAAQSGGAAVASMMIAAHTRIDRLLFTEFVSFVSIADGI
ncbi:MAG: hypothetical protein R3B90_15790 [Planctomycetaceae bacterium]